MKCPYCGQFISEIKKRCPVCKNKFTKSNKNKEKSADNKDNSQRKNNSFNNDIKNSVTTTNLILAPFEVFFGAPGSIILFILFNIGIIKFIFYSSTYNLPESIDILIKIFQFILASLIHILLIKRILYHLDDRKINLKKKSQ